MMRLEKNSQLNPDSRFSNLKATNTHFLHLNKLFIINYFQHMLGTDIRIVSF